MTGCAGGWCASKREKCAHYSLPLHPGAEIPKNRLCNPGVTDRFMPLPIENPPEVAKQKETT